jgi:hypothetical protein
LPKFSGINRTVEGVATFAEPDVLIRIRVARLEMLHLLPQHRGEPWIIVIIDFHDDGARWRIDDKTLVRRIAFQFGIKRYDDLAAILADRRDEGLPGRIADGLRFFDPDLVDPLKRADAADVVAQAFEQELGAVGGASNSAALGICRTG